MIILRHFLYGWLYYYIISSKRSEEYYIAGFTNDAKIIFMEIPTNYSKYRIRLFGLLCIKINFQKIG